MSEELNPGSTSNVPDESSGEGLAQALEALITARASGASASGYEAGGVDWFSSRSAAEGCPEPGEWARLLAAEGIPGSAAEEDALLAHAAVCHACAERLRIFASEPSAEESAQLAGLACASPAGQRNLAGELARTPHRPERNPGMRIYLWTGAGLAASLLIAAVLLSWWRMASNPERLLAEAYTQQRIFDLRMPNAGYAEVTPLAHLRGGTTGRESPRLLEAKARIARNLENAPDNSRWLQLEARADVLEENFDPAIAILDRLVAAGPVTSSLLLDDASAYFQRGEATGSESDRNTALDDLRRADELNPGDPVVLFNEALAMEDRGQLMNAVETWNRYLRFERDPRWLAEGRGRLAALEQKLNQLKTHRSRMEQHLGETRALTDRVS